MVTPRLALLGLLLSLSSSLLLLWLPGSLAKEDVAQEVVVDETGGYAPVCKDQSGDCVYWAQTGECDKNPGYMLYQCQVSCETCGKSAEELIVLAQEAQDRQRQKEEEEKRLYDNFGVDQEVDDVKDPLRVRQWLKETRAYMEGIVRVEERYAEVERDCQNRDSMCTAWAVEGYCEPDHAHNEYMELQCAPACRTCHSLIFEERCPWDPETAVNAWEAGSLDTMFERVTTHPYYLDQYKPQILSKPGGGGDDKDSSIKDGPWVVVLENFIKDDECDRLIELGATAGYELSKDIGERQFDGSYGDTESDFRTSTNAWCTDACYDDEVTQRVVRRMENLTDIPDNFAEHFQLLRYQEGQFYGKHHDYAGHIKDRAEGVRILTVFFYLNTVEAGGGTHFPQLNITVMPRKGRALLWPSVLNDAPNEVDSRTEHEALPVEKGIKYGANAWVHMRDFKTLHAAKCTT